VKTPTVGLRQLKNPFAPQKRLRKKLRRHNG